MCLNAQLSAPFPEGEDARSRPNCATKPGDHKGRPYEKEICSVTVQSSAIVQRIWNYCNVLRDDGVSYGDYLEQLTYLLFLKMDAENSMVGLPTRLSAAYNWASLTRLDGAELETHYRTVLTELGKVEGLILRRKSLKIWKGSSNNFA